jgi:hypothetical protein
LIAPSDDQEKRYAKLIARAWLDPAFKERLMTTPRAVLREQGIDLPPDVEVQVVEDTENLLHVRLPPLDDANDSRGRPR